MVLVNGNIKLEVFCHLSWNIRQIKNDSSDVCLITKIFNGMSILGIGWKKKVPIKYMRTNVCEFISIVWITKNSIPRKPLNRMQWQLLHLLKPIYYTRIFHLNSIRFFHILFFINCFSCLRISKRAEEVWKLFFTFNSTRGCVTPCNHFIPEYKL